MKPPRAQWAALRRLGACRRGGSAVEFALIAPFLAALLIGMITVGVELHARMSMADAVRTALHAAMAGERDAARLAEIAEAVLEEAKAPGTVAVTRICSCGTSSMSCTTQQCPGGAAPQMTMAVTVTSTNPEASVHEQVRVQ